MNNIINSKTIALLLFAILLPVTSCDPMFEHNKVIRNYSDSDLTLLIENIDDYINDYKYDSLYFNTDSTSMTLQFKIPANSTRIIYGFITIGRVNELKDCAIEADNLEFDTTNLIVLKDIMDLNNWMKIIEEEHKLSGSGVVNCYFEVTDNQIELK